MSEHQQEVSIEIAGKARTVVFDWAALGQLRCAVGPGFDEKIAKAGYEFNTNVPAVALAIGLKRDWPEVTPEIVKAASPAILEAIEALERALHPAFYGSKDANPPNRKTRRANASAMAKSVFGNMMLRTLRSRNEEN